MKLKYALPPLLAALLAPAVVSADTIAAKDGVVFTVVDGGLDGDGIALGGVLAAYTLPDLTPSDCPAASSNLIVGSEIIIADNNAVINNDGTLVSVDVSACFAPADVVDGETTEDPVDEPLVDVVDCGNPVYTSGDNMLTLPCVEVDGELVTDVIMSRRGSSNNWEVTKFQVNH